VGKPGKTNIFAPQAHIDSTLFKRMYERGDIPACVKHGFERKVEWKKISDTETALQTLDLEKFLPVFFEGLRETGEP